MSESRTASQAAYDIQTFAAQALAQALRVADQMTGCANRHNLAIVEAYRRAASIAAIGQVRNVHCSNCGDTRGGPLGHETTECTWLPPAGIFEEREQCRGDEIESLVRTAEARGFARAVEEIRSEVSNFRRSAALFRQQGDDRCDGALSDALRLERMIRILESLTPSTERTSTDG